MNKKFFYCAILVLVAVAFFVLGRYSLVEDEVYVPSENLVSSVVLAPSVSLNLWGRDESMHKMASVSRGGGLDVVLIDDVPLQKVCAVDEENNDAYFKCVYADVDYWVFKDYVAFDCVSAIATSKLEIFDNEALEGECKKSFKFGSIVGFSRQNVSDSLSVKIFYFDESVQKVIEGFALRENVSTYKDDVEMASIVEKLRKTTRAVPRNELFKQAEKLNPSPAMKKILDSEKVEKITYDYQKVLKSLPGARYMVNMDELNTVDQSKDPFK